MATIDEVLAAMPEAAAEAAYEYLTIDPVTRRIIVPEAEEIFGVEGDGHAERKYFMCPRYVGDNLDLATCFLEVIYRNANGETDRYLVEDLAATADTVTFSWELTSKVTAYKGQIQFKVHADNGTGRDWGTTLATGTSLEGLEPEAVDVEAETSDQVTQLRAMVTAQTGAVEACGAAQVKAVETAAAAAATEAEERVEEMGAAILATIPADYTTLATEVTRLGNDKADAYMVTTETAASHEIHAQSAVLQLELQGVTYRTGTGNPAPDNALPIVGLGSFDAVAVLDGTEEWVQATNYAANTCRLETVFSGGLCKVGTCSHFAPLTPATLKDGTRGAYMLETAKLFVNYGTVAELKAYLAEQYAAGTPVTVWYQKATHDDGAPYYVRAEIEDKAGGYRSIAANVGPAPLFDGDKVETWARSGCDKKLVFDGTEDWAAYTDLYFVLHGNAKAAKPYTGFCSHWLYKYDYAGLDVFVGDSVFYCGTKLRERFGHDVEAWKAYLAEQYAAGTPVTVWYRSIEYTPEKDLRICKVTRTVKSLILNGTEGWSRNTDVGAYKSFYAPKDVAGWTLKELATHACTHFPAVKWNDAVEAEGNSCWDASASWGFRIDVAHLNGFDENATQTEQVAVFRAYLAEQYAAGNPVTVVYPLANPEVYAFDPAALQSLHGLPETVKASGLLSVTYPQDITYTIQRILAAIQALGGAI